MLSRKDAERLPAGAPARRGHGCTDVPCLVLFIGCIGFMGYVLYLSLQPPSDLRRVIHGLDSQHDLCGFDNSASSEPRRVQVTVGRPTPWRRLWPFGDDEPPRNITVLRGARDHSARPLLYYTFPAANLGGMPSAALCVSECPRPPILQNATGTPADDPASYVCTGRHYGTAADRCPSSPAAPATPSAPGSPAAAADATGDGGNRSSDSSASGSDGVVAGGCEVPAADSFFSEVGEAELERCEDPTQECTVSAPTHSVGASTRRAHRDGSMPPPQPNPPSPPLQQRPSPSSICQSSQPPPRPPSSRPACRCATPRTARCSWDTTACQTLRTHSTLSPP